MLPFVRHFYGSPSTYLWEDDSGKTHMIPQGEGGEQGDPLMPLLFSLGMHPALVAAQRRLRPSERIFAFLDDVCVVCLPERVQTVVNILAAELWAHAQIQVHHGKTHVWNRACEEPAGMEELTARARVVDPEAVVWRGDTSLDPTEFVRAQLEDSHQTRDSVAEDSCSAGSPERVVAPFVLCGTTCQFPPAHGATPTVRGFFASPQQRAVDVFLPIGWDCRWFRKCSQGSRCLL